MCEYCNGTMLIGKRQVHISTDKKITVYGRIGLAKDGSTHRLCVQMPTSDHDRITLFDMRLRYCPLCGKKLFKDPIFPQLTEESAIEIYQDPANGPAIGFWIQEEGRYLAVDNREHAYFTKDFCTKEECIDWLAKRT